MGKKNVIYAVCESSFSDSLIEKIKSESPRIETRCCKLGATGLIWIWGNSKVLGRVHGVLKYHGIQMGRDVFVLDEHLTPRKKAKTKADWKPYIFMSPPQPSAVEKPMRWLVEGKGPVWRIIEKEIHVKDKQREEVFSAVHSAMPSVDRIKFKGFLKAFEDEGKIFCKENMISKNK